MRSASVAAVAGALGLACSGASRHDDSIAPPIVQRTLHVLVSGSGTVRSPQVSCTSDCRASLPSGMALHLEAAPSSGASFKGWTGACSGTGTCDLRLDADLEVRAEFEPARQRPPGTFALTVSSDGSGKGRLTSEPDGIDCPQACALDLAPGTKVTMTPSPNWGSRFTLWSGDVCNGTGTCAFSMDADHHVVATFVPVPANHPHYAVTQLASAVGEDSRPAAINEAGQVVGNSSSGPWVYDTRTGTVRRLSGPGETRRFVASGIAGNGDVAGYELRGSARHAVLFTARGEVIDLSGGKGSSSTANVVNAAGRVAGDWLTPEGEFHAFVLDASGFSDLGTLGGIESLAFAINDRGQITGQAQLAAGPRHAFLWEGKLSDLGSLGGNFSRGQAINRLGQVAGMSTLTPGDDDLIHAVVWDGSSMRDLGTLPGLPWVSATGINDAGVVVGNVYNKLYADPDADPDEPANAHYDSRAYVFRDGVMWDLNELIPDLHIRLRTSLGINGAGQILCSEGQVDQERAHAFVLTPR
jgi:probable HAF family extracellular repeat protein